MPGMESFGDRNGGRQGAPNGHFTRPLFGRAAALGVALSGRVAELGQELVARAQAEEKISGQAESDPPAEEEFPTLVIAGGKGRDQANQGIRDVRKNQDADKVSGDGAN